MRTANKTSNSNTELLRGHLEQAGFQDVSVYQYNRFSIRVRIIDERFRGMTLVARDSQLRPILHQLPENIWADVTMLLLLAPGEESDTMLAREFENPTRSTLL
jgi:hypothetical protein